MQHHVARARVELCRKRPHIVADVAVFDTDALRAARRAGRVQHVRRAFRVENGLPLLRRRLHAADLAVRAAQREAREFFGKRLLGQDKVHVCLRHHVVDAAGREVRLGGDVAAAALEDGQDRGDHLRAVAHHDADVRHRFRETRGDAVH